MLGVADPALCPEGVSGETGSKLFASNWLPFFHASENKLPIFLEGFLGSILLRFTEKLMLPLGCMEEEPIDSLILCDWLLALIE